MEISENILKVVKKFEGYEPVARQLPGDPKGIITGGYGTIRHPNGEPVRSGDVFTPEYSLHCLKFEMKDKADALNKVLIKASVIINQNQFDALVSFGYNVGTGKYLKGTTMGDAIWSDNIQAMADAFLAYVKGTKYFLGIPRKVTLPGLVNRRKAERELFLS